MISRPWVADGRGWAGDKGQSSDMAAWALIGQAHNRDTVLQLDAMPGPLRGDLPFMHFSRGSVAVLAKGTPRALASVFNEQESSGMRHGFSSVMKWYCLLINSTSIYKFDVTNSKFQMVLFVLQGWYQSK